MVKAIKNGQIKQFSDRAWFLLGHTKDRQGWQQVPDDYEQAAIPEELVGAVVEKKTVVPDVPEVAESVEDKPVKRKRNVNPKQKNG